MANPDLARESRRFALRIRLRPRWGQLMLASAAAMAVGGCGSDDGNGGAIGDVVSCSLGEQTPLGTLMVCDEASGLDAATVSGFQMGCMAPPNGAQTAVPFTIQFAHAPCSRAGALGGCRVQSGGETVTAWYYNIGSTGTIRSTDIQSLCNSIGATFVSP